MKFGEIMPKVLKTLRSPVGRMTSQLLQQASNSNQKSINICTFFGSTILEASRSDFVRFFGGHKPRFSNFFPKKHFKSQLRTMVQQKSGKMMQKWHWVKRPVGWVKRPRGWVKRPVGVGGMAWRHGRGRGGNVLSYYLYKYKFIHLKSAYDIQYNTNDANTWK